MVIMWQERFYPPKIASRGLFVAEVLPVILSPSLPVILREQSDRIISLKTGSAKNLLSLDGR